MQRLRRVVGLAILATLATLSSVAPATAQTKYDSAGINVYWEAVLDGNNQILFECQAQGGAIGLAASVSVGCGANDSIGGPLTCPGIACVYARGQYIPVAAFKVCYLLKVRWVTGSPAETSIGPKCTGLTTQSVGYVGESTPR
jgi:hypothetical protein